MPRRSFLTRFLCWLAVAEILLRMAAPLLAVGAAQLRGVAVGDVCTVYGVVLDAAAAGAHAGHGHHHSGPDHQGGHGPGSDQAHSGDHCALTALAQLGAGHAALAAAPAERRQTTAGLIRQPRPAWGDASATWVARRKQGPPPPLA